MATGSRNMLFVVHLIVLYPNKSSEELSGLKGKHSRLPKTFGRCEYREEHHPTLATAWNHSNNLSVGMRRESLRQCCSAARCHRVAWMMTWSFIHTTMSNWSETHLMMS
jgi:hypothetical protein